MMLSQDDYRGRTVVFAATLSWQPPLDTTAVNVLSKHALMVAATRGSRHNEVAANANVLSHLLTAYSHL